MKAPHELPFSVTSAPFNKIPNVHMLVIYLENSQSTSF